MFRYLWRHKAFSALLLSFFAAGLCLKPIAAWSGLALLLFLRLTKVHSLLLKQIAGWSESKGVG